MFTLKIDCKDTNFIVKQKVFGRQFSWLNGFLDFHHAFWNVFLHFCHTELANRQKTKALLLKGKMVSSSEIWSDAAAPSGRKITICEYGCTTSATKSTYSHQAAIYHQSEYRMSQIVCLVVEGVEHSITITVITVITIEWRGMSVGRIFCNLPFYHFITYWLSI